METRFLIIPLFFLSACAQSLYVSETSLTYERVSDEQVASDEVLEELIAPYRKDLSVIMDQEIGYLEVDMIKERPESNMGNWLADMFYEEAKAANNGLLDFAIQNYGGIRINSLGKGPISIGKVYEIMPFDNLISIISANGQITKAFLDHIARDRGWPVSKGLAFSIINQQATDILLNGQPLDPDRIYHFALPDYIASGGSGSTMLANGLRKDLNILVRDAFIQHIKRDAANGINQSAQIEGRIIPLDDE